MTWEKLYPISFSVENKIGNLHKIRLFTIYFKHIINEIFHIPLRIYQKIGENMFPTEKN